MVGVANGVAIPLTFLRIFHVVENLNKIKSLLSLIYNHIFDGTACLVIYDQLLCHGETIRDKINKKKETLVFNHIVDAMFRKTVLDMANLFSGLKTESKSKSSAFDIIECPNCHEKFEKKDESKKIKSKKREMGITFRYLERYISDEKCLRGLKRLNGAKLSEPFDDIYNKFSSRLQTIRSADSKENKLINKIRTARNKVIAHKEIKQNSTSDGYIPRLKNYGISYEDVQACIKLALEIHNAASLLVGDIEIVWDWFQEDVSVIAKSFFKKLGG